MSVVHDRDGVVVHHDDALSVLREMPDQSVHSVVCDPQYGLSQVPPEDVARIVTAWVSGDRDLVPVGRGFMGNDWDAFVPPPAIWDECLRVLTPGGHLLAFAGSRMVDLACLSIRLAGFQIRDSIEWLYGSGFPKSRDVSKDIDRRGGNAHLVAEIAEAIKAARIARRWTVARADRHFCAGSTNWTWYEGRKGVYRPPTSADFSRIVTEWPELRPVAELVAEADRELMGQGRSGAAVVAFARDSAGAYDVTAPATDPARRWEGWGTALKPGHEPIIVARKPLSSSAAGTVLEHGTGAINIDGCRVGRQSGDRMEYGRDNHLQDHGSVAMGKFAENTPYMPHSDGRWPPNTILSHAPLLDSSGEVVGDACAYGCVDECPVWELDQQSGISTSRGGSRGEGGGRGAYSRIGSQSWIKPGLGDTGGASRFFPCFRWQAKAPARERPNVDGVMHPTVKPLGLVRWLVRLVTPPDGTVLDWCAGSGTTGEAALVEGFRAILIEREAKYIPHIVLRLDDPIRS